MGHKINFLDYALKGTRGYFLAYARRTTDGKILKIAEDHNIILDDFRIALAKMAAGGGADDAIVQSICFDQNGENADGSIKIPKETDEITTPVFQKNITSVTFSGNAARFYTLLEKDEANGYNISRAMLKSKTGKPVALKCFQSMEKKSMWEFVFEWVIVF